MCLNISSPLIGVKVDLIQIYFGKLCFQLVEGRQPILDSIKMPISEQKAYQFTIEASNMKLSLVLFVLSMVLYVAQVRTADNTTTTTTEATTSTTTEATSSYTSADNAKIVRMSNLTYSIKRKIRVATTASSTKSKSKSARAKARKALKKALRRNKKSSGNRKLNKKSKNRNGRVLRR